jgi:hypothetical protein
MFAYDPSLLDAVESTPRSVEDVVAILQAIDAACADGDGLKWFNWLYLRVTQAVQSRVNSAGFDDCAWIAALDVQFADFYFAAIRSSLSGKATPGCWKALFDRRNQASIARSTCRPSIAIPHHGSTRYNDYTALNATLDSLIDTAKQTLNVRLLGDALPACSHLEDTLAAWSIAAARETAWNNAEVLCHLETAPPLSSAFLDSLDGFTSLTSKTLLVPVP